VANGIQLRVTESAFATLEADPAALVASLLGGGELAIDVPASCASDPKICCTGGTPDPTCGPVNIDLVEQGGDLPRLEVQPVQSLQRVDVVIRARLATTAPIPIEYLGVGCDISIDTAGGVNPSMEVSMEIGLPQDPDEATTRMDVANSNVDIEDDDISVGGNFLCTGADSFLKGFIVDLLRDAINDAVADALSGQSCVACESGTTLECGAFADACESNTCMIGNRCEQRIGLSGRMPVAALFGSSSSGQLGSMDLFDVAGGYAETDDEGVSMGMYSGALAAAEPRDRCGPAAIAPVVSAVAASPFFQGNTRPDTNEPFGLGIGIHQQTFDHLAYAAYESGALCLNIGPGSVDLLHTDGLAPLVMPSIVDFLHGKNSPIVLGLRPQTPPTIAIGPGTTKVDESGETVVDQPLLDILFDDVEIDFFVMLDDQFVRVMTLAADVHLPLNLEVNGMGEIEPVLGDTENAITDTHVTNSQVLRETDAELEERVPVLLTLALPSLAGDLGAFALPDLGGIGITIGPDGIGSIESNTFLAIFADLELQTAMARVVTSAEITEVMRDADTPALRLAFGGDESDLEFSYQIDGGLWSPYTSQRSVELRRESFAIAGKHALAVRARRQGKPMSTDLTPVRLSATFFSTGGQSEFHGKSSDKGCTCNSTTSAGGWVLAFFVLGMFYWRPRAKSIGALLVVIFAVGTGPGCTCSSDAPACPDGCLEGAVEPGPTGRYSSLAAADGRVVAAAFDETLGDLVLVERDAEGSLRYQAIAGIPAEAPTYEPATYRGGVAAPGPEVGLWTSIQLHDGLVRVAYVDAESGAVHMASEQSDNSFLLELVASDTGLGGASYLSLAIEADGTPSIAYLASAIDSGDATGLVSELRVATRDGSWSQQVVDTGPVSCGGYCGDSQVCAQQAMVSTCVVQSSDCSAPCDDTEACVAGSCLPVLTKPEIHDLPEGVGLFAKLLHLDDGTMVLGYYDRILGSLKIATSGGIGFSQAASYESATLDVGMWLTMAADSANLVHLAFQDATGDRLMYSTFEGSALAAPIVVDDGVREGDSRAHSVGASAAILVDGDRFPAIVYQDGLLADVEIARFEQGSWQRSTFKGGDRVDGFYVSVAADGPALWVSHYFYETTSAAPGELEIDALNP
jgi:hypothetical protein